jgi:hypothetical protein
MRRKVINAEREKMLKSKKRRLEIHCNVEYNKRQTGHTVMLTGKKALTGNNVEDNNHRVGHNVKW